MGWHLRQTHDSRAALQEIWLYLSSENLDAADRVIRAIDAAFRLTAASPYLGVAIDGVAPGHRYLVVDGYIVIYCLYEIEQVSELVLVLHGARDWRRLLKDA
jgi:toxin ParE1/3/4